MPLAIREEIAGLKHAEETLIQTHYDRERTRWTVPAKMIGCECDTEFLLDEKALNIKDLNIFSKDTTGEQIETEMRKKHIEGVIPCEHRVTRDIRIEASKYDTECYQSDLRGLRWKRQMLEEELIVTQPIDPKFPMEYVATDKSLTLMPLVSRRKHPELWPALNKLKVDGEEFTFHEPRTVNIICNCSDEQLKESYSDMLANVGKAFPDPSKVETTLYFENMRADHNRHLASAYSPDIRHLVLGDKICKHPLQVKEYVPKHRIGNMQCRACLIKMPDRLSEANTLQWTEDLKMKIGTNVGTAKDIEYCPRFLPILRKLPIKEYFKAMKVTPFEVTVNNMKVCYAGLLHSSMAIVTEQPLLCQCTEEQLWKEFAVGAGDRIYALKDKLKALDDVRKAHNVHLAEHYDEFVSGMVLTQFCQQAKVIDKTFLVIEKRCDSCNYSDIKKEELKGYDYTVNSETVLGEEAIEDRMERSPDTIAKESK